jgi:hypothetical protein
MKNFLSIFLICNICVSQNISDVFVDDFQKNLTAYRITYTYGENFCFSSFKDQIGRFFLDKDEGYIFEFYEVDDLYYPKGKMKLYAVFDNFYQKRKLNSNNEYGVEFIHGVGYSAKISSKSLIGISNKNEIFYISGPVFKNCIANDFNLDLKDVKTFALFLSFKLFNYKISDIVLKRKRRKYILFTAYSDSLKDDVLVKINSKDFDDIQVKVTRTGWTENGTYKWKK